MFNTHQKLVAVFIICLSLIFGAIIYKKSTKENTADKKTTETVSIEEPREEIVLGDSDNDGLKDWQETLMKTDPKNPDSDKDGLSDGQEVKENRDPLKKGPNDKIQTTSLIQTKDDFSIYIKPNLTAQLAQDFMGQYLSKKTSGSEINQTDVLEITQNSLSNVVIELNPKQYSVKDIKITGDISKERKDRYARELQDAIIKKDSYENKNELTILEEALKIQKETAISPLDAIIKDYDKTIANTLKIEVPTDAVPIHMVYLNNISSIKNDLVLIRDIVKDPVKGYGAFTQYKRDALKFRIILEEFYKYFSKI